MQMDGRHNARCTGGPDPGRLNCQGAFRSASFWLVEQNSSRSGRPAKGAMAYFGAFWSVSRSDLISDAPLNLNGPVAPEAADPFRHASARTPNRRTRQRKRPPKRCPGSPSHWSDNLRIALPEIAVKSMTSFWRSISHARKAGDDDPPWFDDALWAANDVACHDGKPDCGA